MDMIITRNSTRFRSLPVYTLTCGKYADCGSAHFSSGGIDRNSKGGQGQWPQHAYISRECLRLQARRCINEDVPSSKHSRRQMERIRYLYFSSPAHGKSQIEITSRSCQMREREREAICGSREEGAKNNGHDLDDSNAFACLRSEKKLSVYTS